MKLSRVGLSLLKDLEGFRSARYRDSRELWTIGYGHLLTKAEIGMEVVSQARAAELLAADLADAEQAVEGLVTVYLTQNQFDALVSFVYNVGRGAFARSTLLRLLNQGDYDAIPEQLRRWNKAGGKVVEGLSRRREREIERWNAPYI